MQRLVSLPSMMPQSSYNTQNSLADRTSLDGLPLCGSGQERRGDSSVHPVRCLSLSLLFGVSPCLSRLLSPSVSLVCCFSLCAFVSLLVSPVLGVSVSLVCCLFVVSALLCLGRMREPLVGRLSFAGVSFRCLCPLSVCVSPVRSCVSYRRSLSSLLFAVSPLSPFVLQLRLQLSALVLRAGRGVSSQGVAELG